MDHVCRSSYYVQDKYYDIRANVMRMELPYCICEICGRRFPLKTKDYEDEISRAQTKLPFNGVR